MKDQQIELHEVEKDLLGTDQERKVPPSKSWPWYLGSVCSWMCIRNSTGLSNNNTNRAIDWSTVGDSIEPSTELWLFLILCSRDIPF